jgi:hypothetical protein
MIFDLCETDSCFISMLFFPIEDPRSRLRSKRPALVLHFAAAKSLQDSDSPGSPPGAFLS